MGVHWIIEIISFLVQEDTDKLDIWSILNSVNNLQGVLIFVVFICTGKVLASLNEKLCPSKRFVKESYSRSNSTSFIQTSIKVSNRDSTEFKPVTMKGTGEYSGSSLETRQ